MKTNDLIFGIRAVIEAIEAGKEIDKILIKKDLQGELSHELFEALRGKHIITQQVPVERINRCTHKNHQGVVAFISAITYHQLDNIVPTLFESGKNPLIVVLDQITDVRNFGAIARTCECAGVDAIVLPQTGSVTVNGDAIKTSAGALHTIPVCKEKSLRQTLRYLKESGFQVIAATEKADKNYTTADYTVPTVIVMGSEDKGVSAELLRICDHWVKIPINGTIASLNVSVAAAVMIYEVIRQREGE